MDRFARQRSLAAVGDEGQARISAASYRIGREHTVAAAAERHYLERAGAEHFVASVEPRAQFAHAELFRHQVARDFAEGAWRALEQLHDALGRA